MSGQYIAFHINCTVVLFTVHAVASRSYKQKGFEKTLNIERQLLFNFTICRHFLVFNLFYVPSQTLLEAQTAIESVVMARHTHRCTQHVKLMCVIDDVTM